MKKKMIYVYPDWEDVNIKEVVIEFCRQFWGFLHVEETVHNVLNGNAQMNLGPDKVGTYTQKMAPMLIGSFTIGVDPAKGKFLKMEYEIDKGKLVHSKQILCKTYWSLVFKGLKKLLETPYSRFEPAELHKATEQNIGEMESCTNCGKSISNSTEFCTFCGAKQEIKKVEILNAEDLKTCVKCGKSISISTEFCTFCGANQEIRRIEILSAEDSKTCIKCGKLIPISDGFCAFCGAKQELKRIETLDMPDTRLCIKCGKSIPRSLKFCTFCGAKLELERVEALDTPKVKSCIKCGKSIPRSLKFCTFCGTQQEFEKLIL